MPLSRPLVHAARYPLPTTMTLLRSKLAFLKIRSAIGPYYTLLIA